MSEEILHKSLGFSLSGDEGLLWPCPDLTQVTLDAVEALNSPQQRGCSRLPALQGFVKLPVVVSPAAGKGDAGVPCGRGIVNSVASALNGPAMGMIFAVDWANKSSRTSVPRPGPQWK